MSRFEKKIWLLIIGFMFTVLIMYIAPIEYAVVISDGKSIKVSKDDAQMLYNAVVKSFNNITNVDEIEKAVFSEVKFYNVFNFRVISITVYNHNDNRDSVFSSLMANHQDKSGLYSNLANVLKKY